jgi:ABC-type multidrug transport system ATPase subunit
LLLLDDPFAGLDAERRGRVLGLIEAASEERGTAVVWSTHDRRSPPDGLQLILDLSGR